MAQLLIMTKEQKEKVADANKVKIRFIYELLAGSKFTDRPSLALDLAKFTGKTPIDYFNPKREHILKLALAAHPELGRKPKSVCAVHKPRVSKSA